MRKHKSNQPAPQAHLDVDWLVGERSDPRFRIPKTTTSSIPWFGILIGLSVVVGTLLAWPRISNHWLRQQLASFLQSSSTSPEESLAVMLALQELGDANRSIVHQLDDEQAPEKRRMAYHLLSEQIKKAAIANDVSFAWLGLAQQIASLQSKQPECLQLRVMLARDIAAQVPASHPEYATVQKACHPLAAQSSAGVNTLDGSWSPLETVSISNTLASASLLPPVSASRDDLSSRASLTNEAIAVPLPPLQTTNETKSNSPRSVNHSPVATTNDKPSSIQSVSVSRPFVVAVEPTTGRGTSAFPQLRARDVPVASSNANRLDATIATPKDPNLETGTDIASMRGLDQLPLENLFGLLVSPQERRVRMVCEELFRRGVSTPVVDVAIELARGDTQQKLDTLEQIVRTENLSPIPLLAWMAQSSERTVRQKAIAILGSMPDPEAKRRLRSLIQREPDSQLQQQIQQALASNGTIHR